MDYKFKIEQHMPTFCEFDSEISYFDTTKELFEIHWVKKFKEGDLNFHQFSVSPSQWVLNKYLLMVEIHGGSHWWVVGYITGENLKELDLPTWEAR